MFLLIDKPKGITSHDVIDSVRRVSGERRVGHAGTLDPNATGLLIVGVGRESTRLLGSVAKGTRKEYLAEIFLGEERDTDDVEGKIVFKGKSFCLPSPSEVQGVLSFFSGSLKQVPPAFSALKVSGKKAYQLARKGKKVSLDSRSVVVHSLKLVDYQFPLLKIFISVSSGFYVRSLARDIGRSLGCGGYLLNLRRTGIGHFSVSSAVLLSDLKKDNWKDYALESLPESV